MKPFPEDIVVVRGGGDLATGMIQKLWRAGIRVVILEVPQPTAIRRTVALSEAVYEGAASVEDMTARLVHSPQECAAVWKRGEIPLLIDPNCDSLAAMKPDGLVDAILAKRNFGTHPAMADIVVAMGPGFSAPEDAHAVVETMRGHTLGRVILSGSALPNTGIPGIIGDQSAKRVLRAPCSGRVIHRATIGDVVARGDPIFEINGETVSAPFPGLLRGLLREGLAVSQGFKTADIDPRIDSDWHSISDKARCIGGGVLEAYLYLRNKRGKTQ